MQLSTCFSIDGLSKAHSRTDKWSSFLALQRWSGQPVSGVTRIHCREVGRTFISPGFKIRCKDEGLVEGAPAKKKRSTTVKTKEEGDDAKIQKKTKPPSSTTKTKKSTSKSTPSDDNGTQISVISALDLGLELDSDDVAPAKPLLEPFVSESVATPSSKGSAQGSGSAEANGGVSAGSTDGGLVLNPIVLSIPVGDREITIETGRIGRQANGAVMIRDGDTMVYTTVCAGDEPKEPTDFLALSVTYQERFSAAGRTSGGYFKREGRARDHEVLVSRLIDRPIRPMIAKGFTRETQILLWVLSYDAVHSSDALSITAAGAALALSDIPLSKPVAGVRVGLIGGEFVVNPTIPQMKTSSLDMVIAGTADAVLMIEGYCDLLSEEQLLAAVAKGQEAIATICRALEDWAQSVGKPKLTAGIHVPQSELKERVQELLGADMGAALRVKSKQERGAALTRLEERLMQALSREGVNQAAALLKADEEVVESEPAWDSEEEEAGLEEDAPHGVEGEDLIRTLGRKLVPPEVYEVADIKKAFKEVSSDTMRRLVVQEGIRSDGRGPQDIRPILASCGLLPRVHGSALFTRGETQAIAVTTLGGQTMGQKLDNLTSEEGEVKRFYLQYSFPPSSVGEAGRVGGQSRREIGHGTLAERALEPVLPDDAQFPYIVRVESTITESNGSSSMASVCGGCLSMLDAGVPLKTPVAGVAMGLILNTRACGGSGEPVILSDILGSEDALGDMDFKVAGDRNGVTAFQMDIKVEGITVEVMARALAQAKEGRRHILDEMAKCQPPPARRLAPHAPRIESMKISPEKVKDVIGSQGKTIRSIIEESGVDAIDVDDTGEVKIISRDEKSLALAFARIEALTMVPEVGKIYRNCQVKSVVMFGAFLEIAPGREGLCHISELSSERVNKVEDFVKEGDCLDVKLLEINTRGQLKLSHRAVLMEEGQMSTTETKTDPGYKRDTAVQG